MAGGAIATYSPRVSGGRRGLGLACGSCFDGPAAAVVVAGLRRSPAVGPVGRRGVAAVGLVLVRVARLCRAAPVVLAAPFATAARRHTASVAAASGARARGAAVRASVGVPRPSRAASAAAPELHRLLAAAHPQMRPRGRPESSAGASDKPALSFSWFSLCVAAASGVSFVRIITSHSSVNPLL